ncbi:MAG: PQQ-binding-like beta-propeller repeat protein [Chloroflexi bacterium]|nr:PQQ-binding-like beta-propeller repeat protein [Chloroflexota bacterium]MBK6710889.1 PQQ-binding-like beta-propeller repeat protein [Chloroflexota bacterium]MBK7176571.1 PQQ-binding-like beta-propeller repeat protein [Chloroflexota bacterium]MBP6803347.1 PQQ-binding-like beta-propeller repeat protein [Chloroflexota bacterium]MBP7591617.1 PQQ-binding-like beta-propeller repeat protein [Chloroflexota bacterium]
MGRLTTRQLPGKQGRKKKATAKIGLQPGDMLQDRYRIVGVLGAGGFSSVYQARDMRFPNVTKLCAVKEMVISAPDPKIRELTIQSFEREASMLAMLDHPAIPDVSDYFTEKDRSYLVLDLIRGKDLDHWLEEQTEPLDQERALDWAIQLCDALGHLHHQKPSPIVFRDMKPSNIMLDHHSRIRLIDFGIAKIFEGGNKGTMIGTEGYSPPEQYRGLATPAGDVYALGATLHHLLTRQDPRLEPPFTFAERPIRPLNHSVTPAFEAIIMRCLAYDPKERFANATALKEALELLANSATVVSEPAPPIIAGQKSAVPTPVAAKTSTGSVASPTVQPLWVFKCEDEIRSKAAVTDNRVLISVYDNNLYAVNKANGEFVWKYPTADGVGASPCVYDEMVFVGSSDTMMYAVDLRTGRKIWHFETSGSIYSSPTARFEHVFFGSDDGYLYALNVKHGRSAWKTNAFSAVRSSPYVDEERVFFGTEGGYIYCLELSTGKTKWQAQARRAVTSSPAFAEEIVFVGSLDATVYALDAATGWAIWRFRTRRPIISSPVVHDGVVYIGSSDGSLYAIDMNSGRQLWTYDTDGQVNSSPTVWQDAVYFGSTDGFVYSVSCKRGDLRWRFDTGKPVISSPTIDDGIVYIGSTNHLLYALPA